MFSNVSFFAYLCPVNNVQMSANKFYVVWKGFAPGVYDSWEEAEIQVSGYPDAQYRSFRTQEAAIEAFREGYDSTGLIQEINKQIKELQEEGTKIEWPEDAPKAQPKQPLPEGTIITPEGRTLIPIAKREEKVAIDKTPITDNYILDALAVDAACSGNPGRMEYRGVLVRTKQEIFRIGPLEQGTNNIGEFLAIVHGLALQEKQGTNYPIYSDSVNAQLWVRQGVCKTKLERTEVNEPIFELIRRAEIWLHEHTFRVPIFKWDTKKWGEIPADFGRK